MAEISVDLLLQSSSECEALLSTVFTAADIKLEMLTSNVSKLTVMQYTCC